MTTPVLASMVVALTLTAFAPPERTPHDFEAAGLDAAALERGLRARVGEVFDEWSISIDSSEAGSYRVALRSPRGRAKVRELETDGTTDADRSRELAATLALLIHERGRGSARVPASKLPRGFVGIESHVEVGPPRAPDPTLGVGLGGGMWLLGDHLQPRARVRWGHSWAGPLRVNSVGAGLGLAAGAPLARFWVGGLVMPAFEWTHARQLRSASAWSGGGELSLLAQFRHRHLVVGLRTGIETNFPPIRAIGSEVVRWGHLRWQLVIEIAFGI